MTKYARSLRQSFERTGELGPGAEVAMPGLPAAGSQLGVPALALGQLVGAILVESEEADRFSEADVAALTVVATLVASLVERLRSEAGSAPPSPAVAAPAAPASTSGASRVRHYVADGSTFIDDDYLTKGVAGRILWSLVGHHQREGRTEFTNREVRLDPSLDLPDFRDNFESRLILLKRRLDECEAPVRIEKTGRGRFRLVVDTTLSLESVDAG
jgi:hypothetical protein